MENQRVGLYGLGYRRRAAGFTQETLAAALGVSRQLLAAWETGRSMPSARRLPGMAELLGCSIEELYDVPPDSSVTQKEARDNEA